MGCTSFQVVRLIKFFIIHLIGLPHGFEYFKACISFYLSLYLLKQSVRVKSAGKVHQYIKSQTIGCMYHRHLKIMHHTTLLHF